MAKEFFSYPETENLFTLLEEASHRSGVSRAIAFEDFLHMSVCTLSGGRMEEEYLRTVEKHTSGKPGKRGCDSIAKMFAHLVHSMEQDTRDEMKDILGDLFQGAITYGEAGQFLSPMPICNLMAELTIGGQLDAGVDQGESPPDSGNATEEPEPHRDQSKSRRRSVHDPCSGSGRMLLAAAHINRNWEFVGQDVDVRCVRMTALNLAFRNLYGYVIWGNTLALEQKLVYKTGFNGMGFIREVPIETCPPPVQHAASLSPKPPIGDLPIASNGRQLELF